MTDRDRLWWNRHHLLCCCSSAKTVLQCGYLYEFVRTLHTFYGCHFM